MARLKLDQEVLGLSSILERKTGARVKDSFRTDDSVYFIVEKGNLWKALGKNGENIKKIQLEVGKKVRIIEFRDIAVEFVKNVVYPIKVEEVVEEGNLILLKDSNRKTKSTLIGREGKNLIIINRAVQRFFPDKEIKVV